MGEMEDDDVFRKKNQRSLMAAVDGSIYSTSMDVRSTNERDLIARISRVN